MNRERLRLLRHHARARAVTEFSWDNERLRLLGVYDRLATRM